MNGLCGLYENTKGARIARGERSESFSYQDRLRAEYHSLRLRLDKLTEFCINYDEGLLEFTPACPLDLLLEQKAAMEHYQFCLEKRAEIENIEL